MVVKDNLVAGVADSEIKKELLGWSELDAKSDKEVARFVEEKEMALKALSGIESTGSKVGGLSGYRKSKRNDNETKKDIAPSVNLKFPCMQNTQMVKPIKILINSVNLALRPQSKKVRTLTRMKMNLNQKQALLPVSLDP